MFLAISPFSIVAVFNIFILKVIVLSRKSIMEVDLGESAYTGHRQRLGCPKVKGGKIMAVASIVLSLAWMYVLVFFF